MSACLTRLAEKKGERLPDFGRRLSEAMTRSLSRAGDRLKNLEQLRLSLNPDRPLNLGFARVNRPDGHLVSSPVVSPAASTWC